MQCPFCQSPNPHNSSACRVCGGPLRATKSNPPTPSQTLPLVAAPVLWARQTLDEKMPPIVAVGFGAGEQTLGLALENGALQLWDFQNDELFPISSGRTFRKPSQICCVAWAPNTVFTGHQGGQVRWHALEFAAKSGAWKARGFDLAPHVGRVLALALTPTHLYSGGSDGVILVTPLVAANKPPSWELLDGLGTMTMLAVGGDDGAVQLWRLEADETPPRLDWTSRKFAAPVKSLAFSPDGALLIARAADDRLGLWTAQTSYPLPLAPRFQQSHVAPALGADNRWLAVANADNGVAIFDIALEKLLHNLPPIAEKVRHLLYFPDTGAAGAASLVVAGAREIAVWKIAF